MADDGSGAPLLRQDVVAEVQGALRHEDLDGWLLYDFHGLNPVAQSLLGLGKTTRRGFVLIPAEGRAVALTHAIERSAWRAWPFAIREYSSWRALEEELRGLLAGRTRLAMEVSPGGAVPTLDLVPGGLVGFLLGLGLEITSSGDLVSRFHSAWTNRGLEDHRKAGGIVADLAGRAFRRAADAAKAGTPTTEGRLSDWIRSELRDAGIVHEADCIVAVGSRAADPHYVPDGEGESIERGVLLLIDLWGGFERSVAADQTWMGFLGPRIDERTAEVWKAVRDARDAALSFLRERYAAGDEVRGYEVDDVARGVIEERGFGPFFVHRTGHSIDTSLHGSGPNLDNLESRDDRRLVPGVGFSVEPGVYIPGEIGVRSEINVHWGEDGPEVTPSEIQREIFLLLDD
ncbi:MAG: M24 family metallopeptidase [Gemmatimonadota bacterium]|nr:M24 family metallopeptidase [Gemmatimonadota bacterium]